jgi:hypothetical protein
MPAAENRAERDIREILLQRIGSLEDEIRVLSGLVQRAVAFSEQHEREREQWSRDREAIASKIEHVVSRVQILEQGKARAEGAAWLVKLAIPIGAAALGWALKALLGG